MLGTIEIGRALTEYKVLVNQVGTAARYLSTQSPGNGRTQAECLVRRGVTDCSTGGAGLLLSNLATATVTIEDSSATPALRRARTTTDPTDSNGVRVNMVRVTVSGYRFRLISGEIGGGIFGATGATQITFPAISSTQRQFAG